MAKTPELMLRVKDSFSTHMTPKQVKLWNGKTGILYPTFAVFGSGEQIQILAYPWRRGVRLTVANMVGATFAPFAKYKEVVWTKALQRIALDLDIICSLKDGFLKDITSDADNSAAVAFFSLVRALQRAEKIYDEINNAAPADIMKIRNNPLKVCS